MTNEIDSHTKNMILKLDGWSNVLTGLGRQGKDKRTGMRAKWTRLGWEEVEAIYACDDKATKIVDYPVDEAFRKRPVFKQKEQDADFNQNLWDYIKEFKGYPKLMQSAKWGRLYGAGFLILGIDDGQDPDQPVDRDNIKGINWVQVLHRWDLSVLEVQNDVGEDGFREPLLYTFTRGSFSQSDQSGPVIHKDRVIRFNGDHLPERLYRANNYFHDTVLSKAQAPIENYRSSVDSLAVLLNDYAAGVFKMKNLAQLIGAGMDEAVMKRLQLIDLKRSMVKSVVVDSEEDFERKATPLSGIKDAMNPMKEDLSAASNIPHTILFGEGSTGNLSGSGESEQEQWDDFIKNLQTCEYGPGLTTFVEYLLLVKGNPVTGDNGVPEGFEHSWMPMKEMSEKDKAEIYNKTAQADQIYIQNQVLTPEEVALSRFSEGEFNQNTQIDLELREKIQAEDDDPLGKNTPEPEPPIPPEPEEEEEEEEPKEDGFVRDHFHGIVPNGVSTMGMKVLNDGTHVHEYWIDGVKYETAPAPTGEPHTHGLMHRKGETGQAIEGFHEIRVDEVEKEGSRYILKSKSGKVLGRFPSMKKAKEREAEIIAAVEAKKKDRKKNGYKSKS